MTNSKNKLSKILSKGWWAGVAVIVMIALFVIEQKCNNSTTQDDEGYRKIVSPKTDKDILECNEQQIQDTIAKELPISTNNNTKENTIVNSGSGNINAGEGNINIGSAGDNAIIISQPNGNVEINQTTDSTKK